MEKIYGFVVLLFLLTNFTIAQKKKILPLTKRQAVPPCQLTEAPTLRGFYLGQSPKEIEKVIPNFTTAYNRLKYDDIGTISRTDYSVDYRDNLKWVDVGAAYISADINENSKIVFDPYSQSPITLEFNEDTDGIAGIVLWFYKDKLYGFSIYYSDYDPPNAQDFAKQLSEKTKLPAVGWKRLLTANIDTPEARKARAMMDDVEAVLQCNGFKVQVHTAYRNRPSVTITDTNTEKALLDEQKAIKQNRKKEALEKVREEQRKRTVLKP